MRRLLLLLALLLLGPAMAQEVVPGPYYVPPPPPNETGNIIYTTLNPPPQGAQYNWNGFIIYNTGGGGLQGGNIPAYNTQTGTFIFGYMQGSVTYNFFGNNDWPTNGIQVDGFKYSWEYFNQDFSRGNISGNISIFGTNNNLLESFNFNMPQTTQGWTVLSGQIDFTTPYERSELGRLQLSFTGVDDRFWAGYWGPQVRDLDVSIMYSTPNPPPPDFLFWNNLAGEWGTFTLTETSTVRYGAEGTYLYATLQPGTYECTNGAWGNDPIGGVVKSCEVGSNTLPVEPVNCETDPANQECAILALTDPEEIADNIIDDILADIGLQDTGQTGDDGSNDGSNDSNQVVEEEEVLIADENNTDLEELLQEENIAGDEEETSNNEETVVTAATESSVIREMVNEEKASALADSINPNVLELALSVAENAVSLAVSATEQASSSTATITSSSTKTSASTDTSETKSEETKSEQETLLVESGSEIANELLDIGRNLNSISLAATQAQSEQSANESISQAETIAVSSGETKSSETKEETTVSSSSQTVDNISTETSVAANNEKQEIEQITELSVVQVDITETFIPNNNVEVQTESEVVAETQTLVAEVAADINVEQKVEEMVVEETATSNNLVSTVENSNETIDSFSDIVNLEIKPTDTTNEDVEFVQSILAQSEQKNDDMNLGTFNEDEKVTIQNDPNLSNAFNVVPNVSNLELLGVINNKQEEKSDAEKRAEEVVAANKEQQEEINKNYMDADQSGIVAAIGADTDVGSYRSAMLNDNNIWYKPEDIYKNVVYKDNVRGSYFLEKGNTDTYKKMVEEQYK